jgi:hypothetical protein
VNRSNFGSYQAGAMIPENDCIELDEDLIDDRRTKENKQIRVRNDFNCTECL